MFPSPVHSGKKRITKDSTSPSTANSSARPRGTFHLQSFCRVSPECPTGVSQSVLLLCLSYFCASSTELLPRVSHRALFHTLAPVCPTRVSYTSVLQEYLARVSALACLTALNGDMHSASPTIRDIHCPWETSTNQQTQSQFALDMP